MQRSKSGPSARPNPASVLWHIWNCVDQAPYDQLIRNAFNGLSKAKQVALIAHILDNELPSGWLNQPYSEILQEAKRLTERA